MKISIALRPPRRRLQLRTLISVAVLTVLGLAWSVFHLVTHYNDSGVLERALDLVVFGSWLWGLGSTVEGLIAKRYRLL